MAAVVLRFGKVGDADFSEQVFDAVVDFAQRFFDGAVTGEVAGAVDGDATGDEQWTVDGTDDVECVDLTRRTG